MHFRKFLFTFVQILISDKNGALKKMGYIKRKKEKKTPKASTALYVWVEN